LWPNIRHKDFQPQKITRSAKKLTPDIRLRARWLATAARDWSELVVNLGEQLFSEPRTVGANEKTKDHTCAAAAPGEKGQITGYRAKKDRHMAMQIFSMLPLQPQTGFFLRMA
jgi:hypothetical protein